MSRVENSGRGNREFGKVEGYECKGRPIKGDGAGEETTVISSVLRERATEGEMEAHPWASLETQLHAWARLSVPPWQFWQAHEPGGHCACMRLRQRVLPSGRRYVRRPSGDGTRVRLAPGGPRVDPCSVRPVPAERQRLTLQFPTVVHWQVVIVAGECEGSGG